jgi:methylglutaconyl-CoA hydratase
LLKAFKEIENEKGIRVLVLGGRGQAFCAGGDLSRMEQAAKATRANSKREAGRFAKLLYRMHTCPKPLIARVHGPAFAGGMGLVAACDLVVASEEAEFCLPEVRIGLVPAMISPYIVRAMGEQQARRYVLSAERLGARDALRIGFVHECVPAAELDARVEKLAAQLAQAGPQALARAKKLLAYVARAPISPALAAHTAGVLADVRAGAEAREGIRSFLEKRKPGWTGG